MVSQTLLAIVFSWTAFFSGVLITWWSIRQSRADKFYSDTVWLWPWGVFVWGDGIIIGPFWALSAIFLQGKDLVWLWRYYLLFWVVRSSYEVVYWILHQASGKEYEPPLFRKVKWLNSDQAGILYQLLNMCQVIFFGACLGWSLWG